MNPQRTGTNSVPVGPRRRCNWLPENGPPGPGGGDPRNGSGSGSGSGSDRRSYATDRSFPSGPSNFDGPPERSHREYRSRDESRSSTMPSKAPGQDPSTQRIGRKRKSRWGEANPIGDLISLPTAVNAVMTSEQLEAYALHVRIQEITKKLEIGMVVPEEKERSPSPPPQYDEKGHRSNTREVRYRKKLEAERHALIQKALATIPNYHPPADYLANPRQQKTEQKIYIPAKDFPDVSFIGQLCGPRGTFLKDMEEKSGAKIMIRGKGSVKEGRGRSDKSNKFASDQDDELHVLIRADAEHKVNRAKQLVNDVITAACTLTDNENANKKEQLRKLAIMNGTFRDDENQTCQNCGKVGHRKFECPDPKNFTANITCRCCGNAGHFARDCKERVPGTTFRQPQDGQGQAPDGADVEYQRLMNELGMGDGSPVPAGIAYQRPAGMIEGAPEGAPTGPRGGGGSAMPWRQNSQSQEGYGAAPPSAPRGPRGPGAAPPWQQQQQESAPRPWAPAGPRQHPQAPGMPVPAPPPGVAWNQFTPTPTGMPPGAPEPPPGYSGGGYQIPPPPPGLQDQNGYEMGYPPPPPPPSSGKWDSNGAPPPPPPGGWDAPPPPPPSDDVPPPPPPSKKMRM